MYRVQIEKKQLTKLPLVSFADLGLKERFDIQEWVANDVTDPAPCSSNSSLKQMW